MARLLRLVRLIERVVCDFQFSNGYFSCEYDKPVGHGYWKNTREIDNWDLRTKAIMSHNRWKRIYIVNYKSAEQSIGIENCCANNTLAYSSTQPDRKNHLLPVSIFMGNFRSNKNENLLQQTIVTKCMARIQSHSLLPWWTPFRWIYSFGPFPRRSN